MIDYHIHTSFSKDGKQSLHDMCLGAKEKGMKYIAVTDHMDYGDLLAENWEIEDIGGESGYIKSIEKARDQFPELEIAIGAEAGYTSSGNQKVIEKLKILNPDFVIGSLHFVNGLDIYDGAFFEGKTKKKAYKFYFELLYESLKPLSEYSDVIGHLTYVSKSPNAPYDDLAVHYSEFKADIDDVLKQIISLGMGIEINTSGLYKKVALMLPHFEIVKRYRQLGGEILTVGSDAHHLEYVAYGITDALNMAKEAGFDYITVFPNGKQTQIKID